jgi:hypothetical protein
VFLDEEDDGDEGDGDGDGTPAAPIRKRGRYESPAAAAAPAPAAPAAAVAAASPAAAPDAYTELRVMLKAATTVEQCMEALRDYDTAIGVTTTYNPTGKAALASVKQYIATITWQRKSG